MRLYLGEKEEFREKFHFYRRSLIRRGLCVSFNMKALLSTEKIPFEYWNNWILLISVKARFFSWFFQIAKSSWNNFYCFIIHTFISQWKKEIPGKLLIHQKELDSVCIVCSDKVTTLLCAEKIPSEYWNNKILSMSLKTQFCLWFFQVTKSSLTNFYCFNIHALISLRKRGIPGHNIAC